MYCTVLYFAYTGGARAWTPRIVTDVEKGGQDRRGLLYLYWNNSALRHPLPFVLPSDAWKVMNEWMNDISSATLLWGDMCVCLCYLISPTYMYNPNPIHHILPMECNGMQSLERANSYLGYNIPYLPISSASFKPRVALYIETCIRIQRRGPIDTAR